jgi:hypothetical protein
MGRIMLTRRGRYLVITTGCLLAFALGLLWPYVIVRG